MPQSKKRNTRHHHQNHAQSSGRKDNYAIIYVAIVFFGLLGSGIMYFVSDRTIEMMILGFIAGGGAGFLFGYRIYRSVNKK